MRKRPKLKTHWGINPRTVCRDPRAVNFTQNWDRVDCQRCLHIAVKAAPPPSLDPYPWPGAVTGRLSGSVPQMQTIVPKTETGRQLRKMAELAMGYKSGPESFRPHPVDLYADMAEKLRANMETPPKFEQQPGRFFRANEEPPKIYHVTLSDYQQQMAAAIEWEEEFQAALAKAGWIWDSELNHWSHPDDPGTIIQPG